MVVKDAVIKAETLNKYLNGSFFLLSVANKALTMYLTSYKRLNCR